MAVVVTDRDGVLHLHWAEASILGLVERQLSSPEPGFAETLVADSLRVGGRDVWVACSDDKLAHLMQEAADLGGYVVRQPREAAPPVVISEPFELFRVRRVRPSGGGHVLSFCEVKSDIHDPLVIGDVLGMAYEVNKAGGADIAYTDAQGWLVGMHGRLARPLDDLSVARLAEVRVAVQAINWNRDRNGAPLQMVAFEIPADVDALLAGAKLHLGKS